MKVWQLTPKCLSSMFKNSWKQYIPFHYRRDQRPGRGHVHTLTLVPWKHTAPDESLHKKRNWEGTLDTLTEADLKLCITASLLGRSQLFLSSTVITETFFEGTYLSKILSFPLRVWGLIKFRYNVRGKVC